MSIEHSTGQSERDDPKNAAFRYQLEFLKLEFDAINKAIARIDDTTAKVKNWTMVAWAGGVALSLGHSELKRYILLTAIIPIPFYYVDAWWRRIQRSFIFRVNKISEFLNGECLQKSFHHQRLMIDFRVLDPRAKQHANTVEYELFTSVWRTMRFRELSVFYVGLALISAALWLSAVWLRW